jgi:hypothetical protein
MAQQRHECKDVCEALSVREVVEKGIMSEDSLNALNALELAHMLPIEAVSTHVMCVILDEVVDDWHAQLRQEKVTMSDCMYQLVGMETCCVVRGCAVLCVYVYLRAVEVTYGKSHSFRTLSAIKTNTPSLIHLALVYTRTCEYAHTHTHTHTHTGRRAVHGPSSRESAARNRCTLLRKTRRSLAPLKLPIKALQTHS